MNLLINRIADYFSKHKAWGRCMNLLITRIADCILPNMKHGGRCMNLLITSITGYFSEHEAWGEIGDGGIFAHSAI